MKKYKIVKSSYGFYEVDPKPSEKELTEFYKNKYFQSEGVYKKRYNKLEIDYTNNSIERKVSLYESLNKHATKNDKFLDIGYGEGWTLNYFFNILPVSIASILGRCTAICLQLFPSLSLIHNEPEVVPKYTPVSIMQSVFKLLRNTVNQAFLMGSPMSCLNHEFPPSLEQ